MNSYTLATNIPTKKPFGTNMEEQERIMKDVITMFEGMRCLDKKANQPKKVLQTFQKGVIISSKSLLGLYKHLKEKYEIKFILTHRLNQDCLENFFSQLRTRGGLHDHPSPLNALYRIRMILLGKNPGIVQVHSNVSAPTEDREEYLLAESLKRANITNLTVKEPILLFEEKIQRTAETESMSSSSSASTTNSDTPMSENDGLIYIAGYIAKKHLSKFPYLGQHTGNMDQIQIMHAYGMPSWVQSLSFGGLIQPSEKWIAEIKKMERYFIKMHSKEFSEGKDIIKRTIKYIAARVQNMNIPLDLIKEFSRTRIFIRIKYLNQMRVNKKSVKIKWSDSSSNQHKIAKKMKKIVN